jgi:hypothetical protein
LEVSNLLTCLSSGGKKFDARISLGVESRHAKRKQMNPDYISSISFWNDVSNKWNTVYKASPQSTPPQQKEVTMTFKSLIDLSIDKESSVLGGTNLGPAMEEALQARQSQLANQAAEELIELVGVMDTVKKQRLRNIRSYRKEMEKQKRKLDAIDRGFEYGSQTGNFLPLLISLERVSHHSDVGMDQEDYDARKDIPAGWKSTKPVPQPQS